jgi:hypothetical protein
VLMTDPRDFWVIKLASLLSKLLPCAEAKTEESIILVLARNGHISAAMRACSLYPLFTSVASSSKAVALRFLVRAMVMGAEKVESLV